MHPHPMELEALVQDIADVLKGIDSSVVPFKSFRPGVGPYGEPPLVKLVAEGLNRLPLYGGARRPCVLPI